MIEFSVTQLMFCTNIITFVKDHKKKKINGRYLYHLVVPSESFISGFSELEYLTIKDYLNRSKIRVEVFALK